MILNQKETKMKTKRCGIFVATAAVLLMTALLVTNCLDPVGLPGQLENSKGASAPEMGTLRINIADSNARSTILPVVPTAASYGVIFTGTGATPPASIAEQTLNVAAGVGTLTVPIGEYTVTIIAYRAAGRLQPFAMGFDTEVEITSGTNTANITNMKEYDATGTGTFFWDFDVAMTALGTVTSAEIVFTEEIGGEPVSDIDLEEDASGSIAIASGYYNVAIRIIKDGHFIFGLNRALHVYQNMDSTWTQSSFALVPNVHTITYDSNGGDAYTVTETVDHNDPIGAAPVTNPTRTNFTFVNWFATAGDGLAANMGTAWNFAGANILRSRTLYAGWVAVTGFSLTINLTDYALPVDLSSYLGFALDPIDMSDIENNNVTPQTIIIDDGGSLVLDNIKWFANGLEIVGETTAELEIDLAFLQAQGWNTPPIAPPYLITFQAEIDGQLWSAYISLVIIDD